MIRLVERARRQLPGLGLLPVTTTIQAEKRVAPMTILCEGQQVQAYEIRYGHSQLHAGENCWYIQQENRSPVGEGCRQQLVFGTYAHNVLHHPTTRRYLLGTATDFQDPLDEWADHLLHCGVDAQRILAV